MTRSRGVAPLQAGARKCKEKLPKLELWTALFYKIAGVHQLNAADPPGIPTSLSQFTLWRSALNLYMRRVGRQLQLSIEHRAAAGRDWFPLALQDHPPALALEIMDQRPAPAPLAQPSCQQRIEQVLAAAGEPLTQKAVRDMVRMRTTDVSQALAVLVANGRVIKSAGGYQLQTQFRLPLPMGS